MSEAVLSQCVVGLLIVPLVAAVVAAVLGASRAPTVRLVSLIATLVTLLLAAIVALNYQPAAGDESNPAPQAWMRTFQPQMATRVDLLPLGLVDHGASGQSLGAIQFHVGIDGLNLGMIGLTALLMVSSVLISWTTITERANEYYASLLLLETAMIGVFLAFDIVLFYAFFELTLLPLFVLIGIWGGPQRQYAAKKFFIYTLAASLITLLGVLGVVLACHSGEGELTFQIPRLVQIVQTKLATARGSELAYWIGLQKWVFLGLMAGFAVKVPLVPLHTWLPLAHVEAPTAGSVLLAGVLLKIGVYGFLRLCLPLAPDASLSIGVPLVGSLAVIGILYGAFCALAQADIKKLVAYSSVSHLGYCMLGLFALNQAGIAGCLLQMINHGLSTGGLFLLVGMLYERYHTRQMADYGGMASRLPWLAFFMVFISLSSVGLPGLNGFVGEMLVLMGMYDLNGASVHGPTLASLAAVGLVLGAWYLLTMLRRVFFGELREPHVDAAHPVGDINARELAAILPIAALCLLIGLRPQPFLDLSAPEVRLLVNIADRAKERTETSTRTLALAQGEVGRE